MENKNTQIGMEFSGALQILFIALKLLGVIDWSWWWVLSPCWMSIAFVIALLIIFLIFELIVGFITRQ